MFKVYCLTVCYLENLENEQDKKIIALWYSFIRLDNSKR